MAILAISDENQQIFSGFSRLQKRPEVFYENIIVQSKVQRAITKITEESEDKIQKSQISKIFDTLVIIIFFHKSKIENYFQIV